MNYDSSKNQRILDEFVRREIKACVTDIVKYILYTDDTLEKPFYVQDIENEENADGGYKDILEWWIVSDWVAEKLGNEGEAIIPHSPGAIWGRTCSGQGIAQDYVIGKICENMEILEGQKYEWKV